VRTAILAAAASALALAATSAAEAPRLNEQCLTPDDRATVVSFKAVDGVQVLGATFGKGELGVVLGHQWGSDLCEWVAFAHVLTARGYRVLAIDFRGYGSTKAPLGRPSQRLQNDVLAAGAELRREGSTKVAAIGASMGGTAVLVAAAQRGARLAGVVSLSGATGFRGMDALGAVTRLTVPVRFAASKGDTSFAVGARELMKATRAKDKALLLVPGGIHGSSMLDGPYRARVRGFVLPFLAKLAS
jgi:alpha-beta hydrolase superfamily lysophospholipase